MEIHITNLIVRFGLAGIQYKCGKREDLFKNLEYILTLYPKHDFA
jgi:hypothetical protein